MDKVVDAQCPGNDPARKRVPEVFACPNANCEGEVEIWSDEDSGKCSLCKQTFQRDDMK